MAEAATEAADGHTHESACLNCGAALVGPHCHVCGQRAHVHRTLGAFFHDLLHGVLHFEGKTWRTLPMLAWRPGELTRRYIDGERARFVSPLALFLFSVFLMFAVFSSIGGPVPDDAEDQVQADISNSVQEGQARLADLQRQRGAVAETGRSTRALDAELSSLRDEITMLEQAQLEGVLVASGRRIVNELPDGFVRTAVEKFNADPALTLYKLQNNAYKFSWLLIPIMVPLVWLLFAWRRRHWQLYDHTVFVTYQLSLQSFAFILLTLLSRAGVPAGASVVVLGFYIAAHVQWQFRGAYGLSWFSSFWRMIAFTVVFAAAFILFALALIAIGATG